MDRGTHIRQYLSWLVCIAALLFVFQEHPDEGQNNTTRPGAIAESSWISQPSPETPPPSGMPLLPVPRKTIHKISTATRNSLQVSSSRKPDECYPLWLMQPLFYPPQDDPATAA